jgi:hypothetical protein
MDMWPTGLVLGRIRVATGTDWSVCVLREVRTAAIETVDVLMAAALTTGAAGWADGAVTAAVKGPRAIIARDPPPANRGQARVEHMRPAAQDASRRGRRVG